MGHVLSDTYEARGTGKSRGCGEVEVYAARYRSCCCRRPRVGEYVLVHAGYAIAQVDTQEAEATLQLLREALAAEEGS
ncbi:MAG: HypC/HybG/HupF family hydrogenase formation chaperone [Thermoanaerobaculaceae bacterium]